MKKLLVLVVIILTFNYINTYGEVKHNYKAAVLIESNTGKLLYSYNKDKILPQASITKLMTYYTFMNYLKEKNIKTNTSVKIEKDKFNIPKDGVQIHFKASDIVKIQDIINTMLIISANDSAEEIEYIYNKSKLDIIKDMNKNCRELGLTKSHYINTTGITELTVGKRLYNTTSAYETALLAKEVINKYPQIITTTSKKSYLYKGKRYYNTNLLLNKLKRVDGLKTGHTDEAGYCLVATENVTDLIGNGKNTRLIAVILGCPSENTRVKEAAELLKYGEANYSNFKALDKDKALIIKNDKYENGYIKAAVKRDYYILKNNRDNIEQFIQLNSDLPRNILKGEYIGEITVKNGKELFSEKLFAQKDYKLKPLFIRILISIRDFFINIWKLIVELIQ